VTKANVKFAAVKVVQKPTRVKFETKSGETVFFRTLKTFTKQSSGALGVASEL
jgi:hypothetical protein